MDYQLMTKQVKNYPTFNGILLQPMNQITNQTQNIKAIFLGDIDAAQNIHQLKSKKINAVLTIAHDTSSPLSLDLKYNKKDIQYHLIIPAQDQDEFNITQYFDRSFKFLDKVLKDSNVLIHCQAGVSRSATILIAYLMKTYKWNTEKAYDLVKKKRKLTCPNLGFCRQLKEFEKKILGGENIPYQKKKNYNYQIQTKPYYKKTNINIEQINHNNNYQSLKHEYYNYFGSSNNYNYYNPYAKYNYTHKEQQYNEFKTYDLRQKTYKNVLFKKNRYNRVNTNENYLRRARSIRKQKSFQRSYSIKQYILSPNRFY